MWKMLENQPFLRAYMAGLGKYHMARYGWIGVYMVNDRTMKHTLKKVDLLFSPVFQVLPLFILP